MPLITQSDPGSENYGVANAQTMLRHMHDPSLEGTVQHRWMRHKKNVKPEGTWSQLRRRWTPGFENLIEQGVTAGWYDITRPIDAYVFCSFSPVLQDCTNSQGILNLRSAGFLFHGFKLSLMHMFTASTSQKSAQTKTKCFLMAFRRIFA